MKEIYSSDKHHRRSIRLPNYDYARAGAYFLTLCTHERSILFGEITDGEMALNEFGHLVEQEWAESERIRAEIQLDEWVVMPNHFHGIVWIIHNGEISGRCDTTGELRVDTDERRPGRVERRESTRMDRVDGGRGERPLAPTSTLTSHTRQLAIPAGTKSKSIGALVAGFKSSATKRINGMRGTPGSPVWQRNYYEHIIRDEVSLNRIRQYIKENPALWDEDIYNPVNSSR